MTLDVDSRPSSTDTYRGRSKASACKVLEAESGPRQSHARARFFVPESAPWNRPHRQASARTADRGQERTGGREGLAMAKGVPAHERRPYDQGLVRAEHGIDPTGVVCVPVLHLT